MSSLPPVKRVVIVGGGQAGAECATELRRQGFEGEITLLTEEASLPYKRPPLSKAYLAGNATLEQLLVLQPAALEKQRITVRTGCRVNAIDRETRRLQLVDGEFVPYDRLVLATGGRARRLDLPGSDAANVFTLRSVADVNAIRAELAPGKRVVIIGGGFIGLEAAAVLIKQGHAVTLLEGLDRVLARVTAPPVSAFFERVHREAGVDLRLGVRLEGFEGHPRVHKVRLADGEAIAADVVIVGIGLLPNVELAAAAGLAVDDGIVVDRFGVTSDPCIYAAGDCTRHPSDFLGRSVRLESVQNALEQGRNVARNLMGKAEPYQMVPWFWSDQYDLKLQMVGLSTGYDQLVLRGDPSTERSFAAFYLREGRLIAVDTVSQPQVFMQAKKLVAARVAVPDPRKLQDLSALTASA